MSVPGQVRLLWASDRHSQNRAVGQSKTTEKSVWATLCLALTPSACLPQYIIKEAKKTGLLSQTPG